MSLSIGALCKKCKISNWKQVRFCEKSKDEHYRYLCKGCGTYHKCDCTSQDIRVVVEPTTKIAVFFCKTCHKRWHHIPNKAALLKCETCYEGNVIAKGNNYFGCESCGKQLKCGSCENDMFAIIGGKLLCLHCKCNPSTQAFHKTMGACRCGGKIKALEFQNAKDSSICIVFNCEKCDTAQRCNSCNRIEYEQVKLSGVDVLRCCLCHKPAQHTMVKKTTKDSSPIKDGKTCECGERMYNGRVVVNGSYKFQAICRKCQPHKLADGVPKKQTSGQLISAAMGAEQCPKCREAKLVYCHSIGVNGWACQGCNAILRCPECNNGNIYISGDEDKVLSGKCLKEGCGFKWTWGTNVNPLEPATRKKATKPPKKPKISLPKSKKQKKVVCPSCVKDHLISSGANKAFICKNISCSRTLKCFGCHTPITKQLPNGAFQCTSCHQVWDITTTPLRRNPAVDPDSPNVCVKCLEDEALDDDILCPGCRAVSDVAKEKSTGAMCPKCKDRILMTNGEGESSCSFCGPMVTVEEITPYEGHLSHNKAYCHKCCDWTAVPDEPGRVYCEGCHEFSDHSGVMECLKCREVCVTLKANDALSTKHRKCLGCDEEFMVTQPHDGLSLKKGSGYKITCPRCANVQISSKTNDIVRCNSCMDYISVATPQESSIIHVTQKEWADFLLFKSARKGIDSSIFDLRFSFEMITDMLVADGSNFDLQLLLDRINELETPISGVVNGWEPLSEDEAEHDRDDDEEGDPEGQEYDGGYDRDSLWREREDRDWSSLDREDDYYDFDMDHGPARFSNITYPRVRQAHEYSNLYKRHPAMYYGVPAFCDIEFEEVKDTFGLE